MRHAFAASLLIATFAMVPVNAATVAAPVFSPSPNKFNNPVRVTISCGTSQADIRYTLDGTEPTTSSKRYGVPFEIGATSTLKAKAFKSGMTSSSTSSGKFELVVATPVLSRAGGWFIGGVSMRPATTTNAATLRYTTDGSEPTTSSKSYHGITDFTFREKTTFKVKGFADGYTSSGTVTATYAPAVVVLLHGLNSDVSTWFSVKLDIMSAHDEPCPVVTLTGTPSKSNCYRYGFQSATSGGITWANGDGETYGDLGTEVKTVIGKIAKANDPGLIVLVGHSRGGLAARSYLQTVNFSPAYKVALLTIGTPHLGSPLGRVKWWLDDNNRPFRHDWLNHPFKFLWSPSTGYLATWHSKASPNASHTPAVWALNKGAGSLTGVSSFGEIVSGGLKLGENVYSYFNVFDGSKLGSWPVGISSKDLGNIKTYVFLDLPADWGTDGDGVVPLAAQKLGNVSGLPKSFSTQQTKISRVAHTDETSQTAAIQSMLDRMLTSVAAPAAVTAKAVRPVEEPDAFELELMAATGRLERVAPEVLVAEFHTAIREENRILLIATEELLVRRGAEEFSIVPALRHEAETSEPAVSAEIMTLLGRIGSPEAVRDLTEILSNGDGQDVVRGRAADSLRHIGTWVRPADVDAADAILLNAAASAHDDRVFGALANGIADLGTPAGAAFLWRYARTSDGTRSDLAAMALPGPARSSAIVDVLAAELRADPALETRGALLAGDLLATIGSSAATAELLRWGAHASNEQFETRGASWLSHARDSESLAMLDRAAKSAEFPPIRRSTLKRISDERLREITPRVVRQEE